MPKQNEIVSHDEWLQARKELLDQERELVHAKDALARKLRALPWEEVQKEYTFVGPDGPVGLGVLFGSRRQLIVWLRLCVPVLKHCG